ncbi:uncharacterized protein LOC123315336 [Coccinella septempunctata]|uniref:uncharacterized protein LOC123315336 n=1 Tax=Coccinella septempunctata TaxID=41139 RepID=UPI001D098CA4|nr:uncharacterized protein LOC123315336 [Coccinella septempunctata]XP_044756931.1 uncharacterized protein LOC123315336 [Coccinella septempunctata]
MSSSNDHLPLPPSTSKPRLSPLDFRNTELVSRLLAATPPYLYNMSLLPNSYFFSEMLRSLVQAKQENAANAESMMASSVHSRRSRKRPWLVSRHEEASKHVPKIEKTEVADWPKVTSEKVSPIELIRKSPISRVLEDSKTYMKEKSGPFEHVQAEPPNTGLVLPPAPPIWFPPIYPSPYVDPLHFFIDLRVSGHIYDKSQKECVNFDRSANKEYPSTIVSSNSESEHSQNAEKSNLPFAPSRYGSHNSAFSVPQQKYRNSSPMNLTQVDSDSKCTKFDVKSMGFEKSTNRTGTKYVVSNIESIYRNVNPTQRTSDCSPEKIAKTEEEKIQSAFRLFSENSDLEVRELTPVDVIDGEDPGFKIDVQT